MNLFKYAVFFILLFMVSSNSSKAFYRNVEIYHIYFQILGCGLVNANNENQYKETTRKRGGNGITRFFNERFSRIFQNPRKTFSEWTNRRRNKKQRKNETIRNNNNMTN